MTKLTLLATDVVALYGSLAAVLLLRYGPRNWSEQYALHLVPFSLLFCVWLLSFYIANLYEGRVLRTGRDFWGRLAQAVIVGGTLSMLFFYLIPYFGITPRANLFMFIALFAALWTGVRILANQVLAVGAKKRLLVAGTDGESLELARFVADNPQFGWSVSALIRLGQESLGSPADGARWPMLDEGTDIAAYVRENHIDTIVISPQAYGSRALVDALYGALAARVDFASLTGFSERLTGTVPAGAISQQWFLENIDEGSKRTYENAKRVVDVIAALALAVPTLVITPFVALAMRILSPGPLFYRQLRSGRGGVPFSIVKFRTMGVDAEKHTGAVWAAKDDPRVTSLGRFLRSSRLDELPQLWNILRGDMSLVGPRAERPEIDARMAAAVPFYMERYLIKPGLSGWAQINYPYVASPQDAVRRLEHDLYYIKNRSLLVDLEIILKTINISLRQEGR